MTKGKVEMEFKDREAFEAAVNATQDGPVVNLNGVTVRGGTLPALEYETREDGSIHLKAGEA